MPDDATPSVSVDTPSLASLLAFPMFGATVLSHCTAFVVRYRDRPYLVTNWHNVTGLNPDTLEPVAKSAGIPDHFAVAHHTKPANTRARSTKPYLLYDDDHQPRWLEHPKWGRSVDIAVLPTSDFDDVYLETFPLHGEGEPYFTVPKGVVIADVPNLEGVVKQAMVEQTLKVAPGSRVVIVGYPFGKVAAAGLPIWMTGYVASEPHLDYEDRPVFLVDARTRTGQSGSPVIAHRQPNEWLETEDGGAYSFGNVVNRLLGVYAGRVHKDLDVGRVFKAQCIAEIIDGGVRGSTPTPPAQS